MLLCYTRDCTCAYLSLVSICPSIVWSCAFKSLMPLCPSSVLYLAGARARIHSRSILRLKPRSRWTESHSVHNIAAKCTANECTRINPSQHTAKAVLINPSQHTAKVVLINLSHCFEILHSPDLRLCTAQRIRNRPGARHKSFFFCPNELFSKCAAG